jgi:hypothetical protein
MGTGFLKGFLSFMGRVGETVEAVFLVMKKGIDLVTRGIESAWKSLVKRTHGTCVEGITTKISDAAFNVKMAFLECSHELQTAIVNLVKEGVGYVTMSVFNLFGKIQELYTTNPFKFSTLAVGSGFGIALLPFILTVFKIAIVFGTIGLGAPILVQAAAMLA